jgi:hypothetical protein
VSCCSAAVRVALSVGGEEESAESAAIPQKAIVGEVKGGENFVQQKRSRIDVPGDSELLRTVLMSPFSAMFVDFFFSLVAAAAGGSNYVKVVSSLQRGVSWQKRWMRSVPLLTV